MKSWRLQKNFWLQEQRTVLVKSGIMIGKNKKMSKINVHLTLGKKDEQNQHSPNVRNGGIYNYSKKERKKEYTPDFEEFYQRYPRKQAKMGALKAYLKARTGGASKEEILQ